MGVAIAFDLDGTLVDLDVDIEPVRERILGMFRERGYQGTMRPILDKITVAATEVGQGLPEVGNLIGQARRILDAAEVEAAARATPRPGAVELVQEILQYKLPVGIITNNGRACVAPALERLGLQPASFQVSTRDDVRRPKPAPDGLIRVAPRLAGKDDTIWFIGDSPVDVSAAVAANSMTTATVRALGVPGPRSTKEQLLAAGPCLVVEHLDRVLDTVRAEHSGK